MKKIIFLGYIISVKSIDMDEEKVKIITEWPNLGKKFS
jgi:hypothetical protein